MPPSQVDWVPALVVLGAGIVLGVVFWWRAQVAGRNTPAVPSAPASLRDLEARRDALLGQLRELEDTAAKRSPAQLARERYLLELQAARVLREIAAEGVRVESGAADATSAPAPAAASTGPAAAPGERRALAGFLWGVGSAAAIGLLLYLVNATATPRGSGGSPTGGAGMPSAGAASDPAADAELAALEQAVARNPDDVDAQLALARARLSRDDMMGVWNATQAVLERDPEQPEALSYQALVRLAMGQPGVAEQMLQTALRTAPDLVEAHINLALVYFRTGRDAQGEAAMQAAIQRFPEHAQVLGELRDQMREQGADPELAVAAAGENPHATVAAAELGAGVTGEAGAPAGPAGVAPSAGTGSVRGTIELAPGAVGAPGSIVFVVARPLGGGGGPPLAVKRIVARAFPLSFELGAADSMMGQPLPDHVRLDARIDLDGDPMSHDPSEPHVSLPDVAAGTTDVRLVLGN